LDFLSRIPSLDDRLGLRPHRLLASPYRRER
jgi:hypothetical protein